MCILRILLKKKLRFKFSMPKKNDRKEMYHERKL